MKRSMEIRSLYWEMTQLWLKMASGIVEISAFANKRDGVPISSMHIIKAVSS